MVFWRATGPCSSAFELFRETKSDWKRTVDTSQKRNANRGLLAATRVPAAFSFFLSFLKHVLRFHVGSSWCATRWRLPTTTWSWASATRCCSRRRPTTARYRLRILRLVFESGRDWCRGFLTIESVLESHVTCASRRNVSYRLNRPLETYRSSREGNANIDAACVGGRLKAVAAAFGREVRHIKEDYQTEGDLGLVAEKARSDVQRQAAMCDSRWCFERVLR